MLRHPGNVVADGNDLRQVSVQFAVSPPLYALALRPQDPEQLRAAVDLACRWWGGIRFPWLPLAEDGTVNGGMERLCEVLDVVGIIDLTRATSTEEIPTGIEHLGLRVQTRDEQPPWAMPVRGVVEPIPERPLVVANVVQGQDLDPIALLGVGLLDEEDRTEWELDLQGVSVAGDNYVVPQFDERTAIGVTATAIDNFTSSSAFMTSAALVWVLPDSFTLAEVSEDLVHFWNHRALRLRHRRTTTVIARLSSLRQEDARRRFLESVSTTTLSTPMCVFNGLAVSNDDLKALAEDLGFRVIVDNTEWKERHYQPDDPLELTAVIDHQLASWWLTERYTGATTDVLSIAHRPRWQARIESPLRWRYPEGSRGLISARISSPAITGPRTDSVATLYQTNSRWIAGGLRIFTPATPAFYLDIGMPEPEQVLAAALADFGTSFAVSDKGREIEGVLATSEDLALFRMPAFHAVTAAMTPHPSPRIDRALEGLADRLAEDLDLATAAGELRDITARAKSKPWTLNELISHPMIRSCGLTRNDVSNILTNMVTRGLAKWGFERRCGLCGLRELVSMTEAAAVPRCTGCGRDAAYALQAGEPELHYMLNTLLERVSRNAGLTPLAAAAALRQGGYYVIPGAELFSDGGNQEADLLGWKDDRVLTGEAKAAASLFRMDDIREDIEWAASHGVNRYILTCPEALPKSLLEGAIEVAGQNGLELFQLTASNLTSGVQPELAAYQMAIEAAVGQPGDTTGEDAPSGGLSYSNQTRNQYDAR